MSTGPVTVFLCGDVMLGRGVDQILPYPGDPALAEACVKDARLYVELAEAVNGPVPRPAGFAWPWGEALRVLGEAGPHVRVVNLETSITRSGGFAPDKGIHYRMNPANVPCLAAVGPDACTLANNHVMDFGVAGLRDTLRALAEAGLPAAGAGLDADAARRPVATPVEGGGRVLVFSFGAVSAGVPPEWAATATRPGVDFLPETTDAAAAGIAARIRQAKRPGDIAVASVHWGSNWGYSVSRHQRRFAHALIDGGADLVHGHSSHHPRPVEVHRGRLILYGCGDLVNDYEGITGHEEYRDDLRLLYLASVEPGSGLLAGLRMVPLRARRMRLCRASDEDSRWLQRTLDRACRGLGCAIGRAQDGSLLLR